MADNGSLLGLPEGVRAIAWRPPIVGEFLATSNGKVELCKSNSLRLYTVLIVAPDEGYEFVEEAPFYGQFTAARIIKRKTIVVHFTVANSNQEDWVRTLSKHPLFLKIKG